LQKQNSEFTVTGTVKHIISLKIIASEILNDVLPVFLEYALLLLFWEYEVWRHTGGQASLIPAVRAVLPVLPVHRAPALLRANKPMDFSG
jgi:hypothetical protein